MRIPPPGLLVAFLSVQLGVVVTLPVGWDPVARFVPASLHASIGGVVAAAGLALHLAADRAFRARRTTRATRGIPRTVVTRGVYAWSRNPMYLGGALFLVGTALLLGSGWGMLVVPPYAVAATRLYILPEEEVLRRRFGVTWLTYAARVRRWI